MVKVPCAARVEPPDTGESTSCISHWFSKDRPPERRRCTHADILAHGIEAFPDCPEKSRGYRRETDDTRAVLQRCSSALGALQALTFCYTSSAEEGVLDLRGVHHHESKHLHPSGCLAW